MNALTADDERVDGERAIDAAALSKLRWRCRRGLLENDLLIARLFARRHGVTQAEAAALAALMQLDDNDLLDLFLGRRRPGADLDRPEVLRLLAAVRALPAAPGAGARSDFLARASS